MDNTHTNTSTLMRSDFLWYTSVLCFSGEACPDHEEGLRSVEAAILSGHRQPLPFNNSGRDRVSPPEQGRIQPVLPVRFVKVRDE